MTYRCEINANEFEAHGADTENAGQMFFAELLKTAKGDSEAYTEFVEKFKPKKTTDDCFTPPEIYEVIADWVSKEYGISRARFVRPFYPGGNFEKYDYAPDAVVVDNPPFSIITKIVRWYLRNEVHFFLFAPTLTLFSAVMNIDRCCAFPTGVSVVYANGAEVSTSFLTDLEDGIRVRTAPELYKAVNAVSERLRRKGKKELPKYSYPDNVITSAIVARWCKYGINYALPADECVGICELESQKATGKTIFGGGLLLSDFAAAERAAAERAAAERAAATRWLLSPSERMVVESLGKHARKNRRGFTFNPWQE